MHILAELELDTQRKALLKKGEEVLSHIVEPSFQELMAGRVQHSPDESPKKKEKRISALRFVVEVLAPKVRKVQKDEQGRHELYPTTADKLHNIT
jgi:hypothetical protein